MTIGKFNMKREAGQIAIKLRLECMRNSRIIIFLVNSSSSLILMAGQPASFRRPIYDKIPF